MYLQNDVNGIYICICNTFFSFDFVFNNSYQIYFHKYGLIIVLNSIISFSSFKNDSWDNNNIFDEYNNFLNKEGGNIHLPSNVFKINIYIAKNC